MWTLLQQLCFINLTKYDVGLTLNKNVLNLRDKRLKEWIKRVWSFLGQHVGGNKAHNIDFLSCRPFMFVHIGYRHLYSTCKTTEVQIIKQLKWWCKSIFLPVRSSWLQLWTCCHNKCCIDQGCQFKRFETPLASRENQANLALTSVTGYSLEWVLLNKVLAKTSWVTNSLFFFHKFMNFIWDKTI